MISKTTQWMGFLVTLVLIQACGVKKRTPLTVEVTIAENLNHNAPLPVDMVVVCNKERLQQMEALDPESWFREKAAHLRGANDLDFQVYSWEWTPGLALPDGVEISAHNHCVIFIFAGYRDSPSRVRQQASHPFRLNLGEAGLDAAPLGKKAGNQKARPKTAVKPEDERNHL